MVQRLNISLLSKTKDHRPLSNISHLKFIKTTLEHFTLKVHRPHILVFPTFSSNKRWWRLRAPSFLGRRTREPRVALLS